MPYRTAAQGRKFVGAGAVNTAVTFLMYQALLLATSYTIAYTVSFVFGIALATWMNSRFVFGTDLTVSTALRFITLYLFNYVLGLQLVTLFIEVFKTPPPLAPLAAAILLLPIGFIGGRLALKATK